MTAGTVVITGGILATVILLFIIAVLCYCRLQYYCCKKNGSDCGSISQPHFLCQACHAPSGLEGPCVQPWSLSPEPPEGVHVLCPSCPSYDPPFSLRTLPEIPNGSERVTYVPTHYENQALVLPLPAGHGSLLREGRARGPQQPDFYTNTRAISTEV